jgi:hypothetical protein
MLLNSFLQIIRLPDIKSVGRSTKNVNVKHDFCTLPEASRLPAQDLGLRSNLELQTVNRVLTYFIENHIDIPVLNPPS